MGRDGIRVYIDLLLDETGWKLIDWQDSETGTLLLELSQIDPEIEED